MDNEVLEDSTQTEAAVAREVLKGEKLLAAIEALIFANGEPIELSQLVSLTSASIEEVQEAIKVVADRFSGSESGLVLARIGSSYQFRTKPACASVLRLLRQERPRRLTPAALETLSIIAYRQPIVKSDIEQIRGVDATPTIKTLLDRGLIKIIGHQATVGQPALYSTSEDFLKIFGLQSLKDLPTLRELNEVERDPGEETEDAAIEGEAQASDHSASEQAITSQ